MSHDPGTAGFLPYYNITPVSAFEAPNRKPLRIIRIFFIGARVHWGVWTGIVAMSWSGTKTDRTSVLWTAFQLMSGFIAEDAE